MATSYTSLLGFALPVTGELSGTWGSVVNSSVTQLAEDSVAGVATLSVASGDWTLTTTGGGADNQARKAILIPTGSPGVSRNIIAPGSSKAYIVVNQSNAAVVIKSATTSGVTIPTGKTSLVAWNGSDFVEITPSTISGTLPVANGGTGATSTGPARTNLGATTVGGNVFTLTNPSAITFPRFNADNTVSALNAADFRTAIGAGAGSVTSVAALTLGTTGTDVSSSVLNSTTTPVITLNIPTASASNRGALSSTDWSAFNGKLSTTGGTMTGTLTIAGSTSVLGTVITNAAEVTTVSATAATGTINYDVTTQSVLYYTTAASASWTVNVRASSGTSLNTALATGQSITLAFMVTQGSTAYYNSAFTIDGTSVTPKWQGGTAPTAGNPSGIDVYTYTITKTASATYTVLASLTQFK